MTHDRLDEDPDFDASRLGSGSFTGDEMGLEDTGFDGGGDDSGLNDSTVVDVEVEDALSDLLGPMPGARGRASDGREPGGGAGDGWPSGARAADGWAKGGGGGGGGATSAAADDDGAYEDDDDVGFDPEAGRGAIANKTSLSGAVLSESGLFVLGALAALGGLTSVIFALAMQTRPYVITALIVGPATFVWFILRWRKWLGRAPYLYRLLSTLNEREDAEALLESHLEKKEAKIRAKISKLEAEQGLSDQGL